MPEPSTALGRDLAQIEKVSGFKFSAAFLAAVAPLCIREVLGCDDC